MGTGRAGRRRGAGSLCIAVMIASLLVAAAPPAGATTKQVTVLSPVSGHVTSNPQEPHHRPFGGDHAWDVGALVGTAVHARFRNPNGALRLAAEGLFEPCASPNQGKGGSGLRVGVFVDGVRLGTVYYAHLSNVTKSSGTIDVGERIGSVSTGTSSSCWTGPHVHVELYNTSRYSCFFPTALGTTVHGGSRLGIVGGEWASGINQACPANAEAPSGPVNGSFISVQGKPEVYRLVGGAPIYVSSWNAVGGPQPVFSLSQSQFDALRTYPADGTLVHVGAGPVYRFAGGAPIYVSSWENIGGQQPTTRIDQAALDQAGQAGVWGHVRRYPVDGTLLRGRTTTRLYRVTSGAPYRTGSSTTAGVPVDQAAIDNAGSTGAWRFLKAPVIPAPTISGVEVPQPGMLRAAWQPAQGVEAPTGFEVSLDDGTAVDVRSAQTHTWSGLTGGVERCVRVRTRTASGTSAWSAEACGVVESVPDQVPPPEVYASGPGELAWVWRLPRSDGGSQITGFVVARSDGTRVDRGYYGDHGTYIWRGLADGQDGAITVAACNAHGCGEPSAVSGAVATSTPPPYVIAAWGAHCGPDCRGVLMQAEGFAPGEVLEIACHDESSGVVHTSTATASSSGSFVSSICRSRSSGSLVWVTVNGVTSNRIVQWTGPHLTALSSARAAPAAREDSPRIDAPAPTSSPRCAAPDAHPSCGRQARRIEGVTGTSPRPRR